MELEAQGDTLTPDQKAIIAREESEKLAAVAITEIKTDEELTIATEMLSNVKRVAKNIKEQKDPIIRDLNAGIKRVRELFRPAEDRLSQAEQTIKAAILNYHEEVAKKAAQKAKRIEKKIDAGDMTLADGMGKLANVKQAETMMHSESGSAQIRVNRKVRITDVASLPASYFLRPRVLEALRMEVADDVLRQKLPCPSGAEVYEEKAVAGSNG